MERFAVWLLSKIQQNPMLAIQWTVVITTFLGAFYVFTPLYVIGRTIQISVLATVLSNPITLGIWALVLVVGSVVCAIGLIRKKPYIRSYGWFIIFLARLYQVLAILIVAGPLPLQWLYPFTLGAITLILWARSRVVDE